MSQGGPSSYPTTSSTGNFSRSFKCKHCARSVPTAQGLKIHTTKKHGHLVALDPPYQPPVVLATPSATTRATSSATTPIAQQSLSTDGQTFQNVLLARLHPHSPCLRRIPKGARGQAAAALTEAIEDCLSTNSQDSWTHLLLFPVSCFRIPPLEEKVSSSLTSQVKSQIMAYRSGVRPAPTQGEAHAFGHRKDSVDANRAKRVLTRLSEGDVRGAVRILEATDTLAPVNNTTLGSLQALHPDSSSFASVAPPTDVPSTAPLQVTNKEVVAGIASFPTGSAGGADLLRPQHLKDVTSFSAGEDGQKLLLSLTKFCNFLLAGDIPEFVRPFILGAALCAFLKPSGGIRPIAIGSTYRRLVAKLCCARLSSRLSSDFLPVQLGFGVQKGVEAVTHASRRFVNHPHPDVKVFLKVDYRNAFNTIHRSHILKTVASEAPEIYPFVQACYGSSTLLTFSDHILYSNRGVQQGDPLGPVIFCMVLQPLVSRLESELNAWYLDDGALGGAPEAVLGDFSMLRNESGELGLTINDIKCELFLLNGSPAELEQVTALFHSVAPDLPILPLHQCTQLGVPLFDTALAAYVQKRTESLTRVTNGLGELPTHSGFYILKNSQALPKLAYLLRCAPTWLHQDALALFDSTLREALSSMLNVSLSDDAWNQASLPTARGGLGIRHATRTALPAFLSSVAGSSELVERILPPALESTLDDLFVQGKNVWLAFTSLPAPSEDKKHIQKEWESPIQDLTMKTIHEHAITLQDQARLNGIVSSESGAFLNVLPAAQLGTLMENENFRVAVALRLGSPICQPHQCQCGASVTADGWHGLSCKRSAGRQPRHATVNTLIHQALTSAKIPSTLEPLHLSLSSGIRPDGVTQIPWKQGKSLCWDYTCWDSMAPSHIADSADMPLATARKAEIAKDAKYEYLNNSHIFVPVASECLGSFGPAGKKLIREIGRKIMAVSGEKQATAFLFQRLSVAIQNGNAQAILGTLPSSSTRSTCLSFL